MHKSLSSGGKVSSLTYTFFSLCFGAHLFCLSNSDMHTTYTHKATAFPCFVPGRLGSRGQTQSLLHVIQTSNTDGPPVGRGYTTSPTTTPLAHQAHAHAYTNIPSQLHHPPPPPSLQPLSKDLNIVPVICRSPMGAAKHIAQLSFSKHTHSHSLSLLTHTRSYSETRLCSHTHTHTVRSVDQRLIASFHQLHHPLLYLSSCPMAVFISVCARLCIHVYEQTFACGCESLSVTLADALVTLFFFLLLACSK